MGLFNVFDMQATLGMDDSDYQHKLAIDEEAAVRFGGNVGSLLGSAAAAIVKVGAQIAVAAGQQIAGLTKQAVEAYAQYEQLVGGVETLFGDAATTVMQDAADAFDFAGMSANEYMENVTGFSASLMQSLGNDTKKTAEYSKKAIKQMSDNANKMGTNISSIQRAYQGFAKQNYTMLDNLKLGYGGTKAEMERLIEDAEELSDTFEATRDENGKLAMTYSDIIDALQIVQDNMGITGTTAKEASTTITGSINAMKASWQNLVVGMADDNADVGALVDQFAETVGTAAENILPRIEIALAGIGQVVEKLAPKIEEALPGFINNVLPSIASAGVTVFGALINNVDDIITVIGNNLPNLVDKIGEAIKGEELLKKITMAGLDFFAALVANAPEIVENLAEGLKQIVDGICEWFENEENRQKLWEAGKKLFNYLLEGIAKGLKSFDILSVLGRDPQQEMLERLGLAHNWEREGNGAGGSWGEGLNNGIKSSMEENGEEIISHMRPKNIIGYGTLGGDWENVGTEMADGLKKGWMDRSDKDQDDIIGKVQELILLTEDELGINSPSKVFMGIGENMAKGLKIGFNNQIPDIKLELRRQVQGLVTAVRNEMQIKSPSKVFAKIGSFMAQGLGDGFVSRMATENKRISASIAAEPQIGSRSAERLEHTPGGKTEITQNIYAYTMTPAEAFVSAQTAAETAEFLGLAG